MGATFFKDLEISQKKESELELKFQLKGLQTSNTLTLDCFPGYDIQTWVSGTTTGTTKYEVKVDFKSSETGNVAVEAYKIENGYKKQAGITATSADYYIYVFPEDSNFYSISVPSLFQMMKNKEYKVVVYGGDGGRYRLCLFDKSHFLSKCSII